MYKMSLVGQKNEISLSRSLSLLSGQQKKSKSMAGRSLEDKETTIVGAIARHSSTTSTQLSLQDSNHPIQTSIRSDSNLGTSFKLAMKSSKVQCRNGDPKRILLQLTVYAFTKAYKSGSFSKELQLTWTDRFCLPHSEILHPENGKIIFHGGIFAIAVWIFGSHGDAIAF
ncbi:hypothetical protein BCR33DRAFT_845856 [Rhizoclosmatium globosum]|uniref:Uncharacterized protein n=1 Tax=Rhizoclosmatium globosum TaxID=329046 RepID=A0A1Y2CZR7_9FUNG|nr:hypothetical protein BCR33DRAFT_845856 [Rhizoclosmatium globosum]|eukprot:ORY51845.1 hypothetical protein BCR33DRAFT_845856 [Rhizoclosmatium globosum]